MLTFPKKYQSTWNQEYYDRLHEETKDRILKSVALLESIRSELGDQVFAKVIKNRDLVLECLNRRDYLRDAARIEAEEGGKHFNTYQRINQPLESRLQQFGQHLAKKAKDVINDVLSVRGHKQINVTRSLKGPYTISASCEVAGWGNNSTTCDATIPKDWHLTPAKEVCKAFHHKFFALTCRREPEFDQPDIQLYFVTRAVRTTKLGFKEPEEGYAAIHNNGTTGWGNTPELAIHKLKRDIAKAAKARLLATLKA
jgi:hypothetical protein